MSHDDEEDSLWGQERGREREWPLVAGYLSATRPRTSGIRDASSQKTGDPERAPNRLFLPNSTEERKGKPLALADSPKGDAAPHKHERADGRRGQGVEKRGRKL